MQGMLSYYNTLIHYGTLGFLGIMVLGMIVYEIKKGDWKIIFTREVDKYEELDD